MATASNTITTTTDVNAVWRKVQTGLQKGLNFEVEEYDHLEDVEKFKANMSTREITVPLDIIEGGGVASIPEDGYEARPGSPNARELTLSWIIQNKRFTITKQARWVEQFSRQAMIEGQFKFQGAKAIQSLAARIGDYFYGFSTGYLAACDGAQGAATSHTITLKDAFGVAGAGDAAYLARRFNAGGANVADWVALIQGGALVTNAIGRVTARSTSAGTIDVSWNGSVTITDGDFIVLANSLENTTISGTDYNRGVVGLLDATTSASVHGLSSPTDANWSAAVEDSNGGRFTGIDIRKAKQEIANFGGGDLTDMWIAQGVERDMFASHQAAVRFSSPMGMQVDGDLDFDFTMHSSRRTPPGYAIGYDRNTFRKLNLLPSRPGTPPWEDGDKLENRPVWAFSIDWPWALVTTNRKNMVIYSSLTEQ